MSDNGFEDMGNHLGKLAAVDIKKVSQNSLEEAANFYASELIPRIPVSVRRGKHAKDMLKVEVKDDRVVVLFEDDAFYWRFVEKGTSKMKATHFASGTWEQNKTKIQDIMASKLLKELE